MDSSCLLSLFVCFVEARLEHTKPRVKTLYTYIMSMHVCTTEEAIRYENHYEIMPFTRLLSHNHQQV